MLRSLGWVVAALQAVAMVLALSAAAYTRPSTAGLDRGGLDSLAAASTRYLVPETTGAIPKLLAKY